MGIPPPNGSGGDEFHRDDDRLAHPDSQPEPEVEPIDDHPFGEGDQGLDGFR